MSESRRAPVVALAATWFALAAAAGASGRIAALNPPLPQLILVGTTLALIALERWAGWLREFAASVDLRALVALHVTRFVGIWFLLLWQRGMLPRAWAVPSGVGDIIVATLALLLVTTGGATNPRRRNNYLVWNALGVADLLMVVVNAARLAMADPASMTTLMTFPLSLVPTFLVPWLLATHVWIFRRLSPPVSRLS